MFKVMNMCVDDWVIDIFNCQFIYYKCNCFVVIGIDDEFQWLSFIQVLDFELEFGCYIGRCGKDISCEVVCLYIVGYIIFNDMSVCDVQVVEMFGMFGLVKSKDFDMVNIMGLCLVMSDELGDFYDLNMVV